MKNLNGPEQHSSAHLILFLVLAFALSGCTIDIVSGPSTVAVGETVTYVVAVGATDGDNNILLFFDADVPPGWQLQSASFEGTLVGEPTVFETIPTTDGCGPDFPGLQHYGFQAGPFPFAAATDTGTATLTFDVLSQPPGEYKVFFRFWSFGENGGACSTPAVRTINRQGPSFLRFREAHFIDGDDGPERGGAIAPAPDGRHLYVAAGENDSLTIFGRDLISGGLTFADVLFDDTDGVDGLNAPRGIAIAPDGLYLYVVATHDASIANFARDPSTGELTFVDALFDGIDGVDGLEDTTGVTLSPDGLHAYVVADFSIAVFARDPGTGALTFVQVLTNSTEGVEGLSDANAVATSPDGRFLYVTAAGRPSSSIAVFARDSVTGELAFVQVLRENDDGVEGLAGVRAVSVAPDGGHVYVASRYLVSQVQGALAVFARDPVTGELTFVEALFNATDAIGLESPTGVAVDPSGSHVFFTGENSVAVFARESDSGRLTFLEAQFDGDPAEQIGLEDTLALAVVAGSPQGDDVYVASEVDHGVAVFRTSPPMIFADGFESGDTSRWSSEMP